jgi:hypothetical protein
MELGTRCLLARVHHALALYGFETAAINKWSNFDMNYIDMYTQTCVELKTAETVIQLVTRPCWVCSLLTQVLDEGENVRIWQELA